MAETIHGPPRKYDPNLLAIMGNPKTKRAEGQLKMRSNQKVEENKLGLKLNFTLESKWADLNFEFWGPDVISPTGWQKLRERGSGAPRKVRVFYVF